MCGAAVVRACHRFAALETVSCFAAWWGATAMKLFGVTQTEVVGGPLGRLLPAPFSKYSQVEGVFL